MTRNQHLAEVIDIRAGIGVGRFQLGMSIDELGNVLMVPGEREDLPLHTKIKTGPFTFWVDKLTGTLWQIMVGRGFTGRFLDRIGIGSTLAEVQTVAGDFQEEGDSYILPSHPGICFELEDVDDWDEMTAPIEYISVYVPDRR